MTEDELGSFACRSVWVQYINSSALMEGGIGKLADSTRHGGGLNKNGEKDRENVGIRYNDIETSHQ